MNRSEADLTWDEFISGDPVVIRSPKSRWITEKQHRKLVAREVELWLQEMEAESAACEKIKGGAMPGPSKG